MTKREMGRERDKSEKLLKTVAKNEPKVVEDTLDAIFGPKKLYEIIEIGDKEAYIGMIDEEFNKYIEGEEAVEPLEFAQIMLAFAFGEGMKNPYELSIVIDAFIDWSYENLGEEERAIVFNQLSTQASELLGLPIDNKVLNRPVAPRPQSAPSFQELPAVPSHQSTMPQIPWTEGGF